MTSTVVLVGLFLVIAAVVINSARLAQAALRGYTGEEKHWRAHGFPSEVRRRYPQLRVQIVDKPRMQLLGYVEAERRPVAGGLRPKIEVLWRAESSPAKPEEEARVGGDRDVPR